MENIEYFANIEFINKLTPEEQKIWNHYAKLWKIYQISSGGYRSSFSDQKGVLFAFCEHIQSDMGAILNKIKKCIIVHYGEFEDDILQEWKEEGFVK